MASTAASTEPCAVSTITSSSGCSSRARVNSSSPLMVRIYLVNFAADYPIMNAVYASYFKPGRFPARTTVGVTNLALGSLVEIDLIVRG